MWNLKNMTQPTYPQNKNRFIGIEISLVFCREGKGGQWMKKRRIGSLGLAEASYYIYKKVTRSYCITLYSIFFDKP